MSPPHDFRTESQSNALRPESATTATRSFVRAIAAPARWLISAAVLLIILRVTLSPVGNGYYKPFEFCIACGRRWLSDGVLNVWLFVPLGMAVVWNTRSLIRGIVAGLLLSTAIEMAQTVMPGRTAAINDIVFNTLGATIGAVIAYRPRAWLFPDARASRSLTFAGIAFAALIMAATSVLLSPIKSPVIPHHGSFYVHALAASTSEDVTPLMMIDIPSEKPLVIGRSGNDLMLRYPSLARASGLDQPEYWLPGAFTGGVAADSVLISVRRERAHWDVRVAGKGSESLGPTLGQGWALLVYPRSMGHRWGMILNAIWIAALCFPIGFWARKRLLPAGAVGVAALLALVPVVTGIAPSSGLEWAGGLSAFGAGALLGWISGRGRPARG